MRDPAVVLESAIAASHQMLHALPQFAEQMRASVAAIVGCLTGGRKLLVCGNGGSAADAAHFATEFVVRFEGERRGYPAICLSSDGSTLTAASNDYGVDQIFARQVAAFAQEGDVVVCLTTSGKSRNIVCALEEAKSRGVTSIAFLGRDGGSTAGLATIEFLVAGASTARIQEAHMLLLHVLCEAVEEQLGAE